MQIDHGKAGPRRARCKLPQPRIFHRQRDAHVTTARAATFVDASAIRRECAKCTLLEARDVGARGFAEAGQCVGVVVEAGQEGSGIVGGRGVDAA